MTKELGGAKIEKFLSILKMDWMEDLTQSILSCQNFFSKTDEINGYLTREIILISIYTCLFNIRIAFINNNKSTGKSYSGLKLIYIFKLRRDQIKNKIFNKV